MLHNGGFKRKELDDEDVQEEQKSEPTLQSVDPSSTREYEQSDESKHDHVFTVQAVASEADIPSQDGGGVYTIIPPASCQMVRVQFTPGAICGV